MEASTDPAILIDFLQAMVSQTTWVYAELWAPSNGRLMTDAVWWRPGKSGEGFAALEMLSRSMALKRGAGLAGKAWEKGELEWSEDLTVKGSALEGSPRQAAVEAAGVMASLTVPVKTDEGRVVAVAVLLSQRVEPVAQAKIAAVEALSASAAPFLEHLVAQRESQSARGAGGAEPKEDWGEGVSVTESEEGGGGKGVKGLLEIKYPPPVAGKFKSIGSTAAMPGASALKHGIGGGAGNVSHRSTGSDPRGHQRGKANAYMTQLVAALQKCNPHEDAKPDAIRTNVAWVVLEQMASDVGAYSECMHKIIDELRPALFGDDLIAMNDGLSMVKAPFFTQLEYRMQQVRDMEAKVEQIQTECDRIKDAHEEVRAEAEKLRAEQAVVLRKAFVAERRRIKIKLSTFLERRQMQIKVLEQNEAEMLRMKEAIHDLQSKLNIREKAETQEIVVNDVERDIFRESVRDTGILKPPMKASLMEPPVQDPSIFGPFQPTLHEDEEGVEMKQQLLILRNARLSDFEDKYRAAQHDRETFDDKEKPLFVLQMHELEEELGLLEDKVQNGFRTPRYELEDPAASEINSQATGLTPKPLYGTQKSLLSQSQKSVGSIKSDPNGDPSEEDEQEEEELTGEELEEQLRFYTDAKSNIVNIWKGYLRRTGGKPRELPRQLPEESITAWVYEIFEEKVRLDTESQNNNKANSGYMTIEKVFYTVLDHKYGSETIANLVAYDFLSFIDEQRQNVKLLSLFASAMSGGWYDADWKYILRVQQFIKALAPQGFPNMLALDEFMVRHFYHDQPQIEIHRVLKAFTVFPTYNRQLAELGPAGEAISAELFAEFVAYLLDIKEEPRLRKAGIMIGIRELDKPITVTYEEFESFANMCVPLPLRVDICQLYYRMMIRAHPDKHFPPQSLSMAITAIELEVLLEHYSVEGNSLQMDASHQQHSPLISSLARPNRVPSAGRSLSPVASAVSPPRSSAASPARSTRSANINIKTPLLGSIG